MPSRNWDFLKPYNTYQHPALVAWVFCMAVMIVTSLATAAAAGEDRRHHLVGRGMPRCRPTNSAPLLRPEGLAALVAAVRRRGTGDLRFLPLVPSSVPGEHAAVKITSVETIPIRVPIKPELAIKSGRGGSHTTSPFLLVKLHTDDGLVGARRGVVHASLVGRGPGVGGPFHQHIFRSGTRGPGPNAIDEWSTRRVPVGRGQLFHQGRRGDGTLGFGRQGGGQARLRASRRQGARIGRHEVVGLGSTRPTSGRRLPAGRISRASER